MKLSKAKYFIFLFLTVSLGFAVGFFSGAYPQKISEALGKKKAPLSLVFSDEKLVPMQALLDFEKSTGTSFQVKVIPSYFLFQAEIASSDLIFIPFSWYENSLPLMIDSPSLIDFTELLFSDFASLRLASGQFFPIFWQVEKNKGHNDLLLWGFSVGKKKTEVNQTALELISFLTKDASRMQTWVQQTGLNSTLNSSNSFAKIPDSQKAQQLRNHPLSELNLKHQLD